MHSGHARAQRLLAILGFSALAVSEGAAAAGAADIGPTSRATVEIRVSVAERAGVRMSPPDSAARAAPCVASTARNRTFAARLEPLSGHGERGAPPPFEIPAVPTGLACSGNQALGNALAVMAADGSPDPHVLILAPQ